MPNTAAATSVLPSAAAHGGLPPGWHGKLPSLGDFASRRLGSEFIEPWDGWLASGLLALREQRPEAWLQDYLGSPSWRFLLMPGVLPGAAGRQGWAGVLMPSVDRVGRYFPLTLVLPLGAGPAHTQEMNGLWAWLSRLDELARDALFEDWTGERLEDELSRMALPALTAPPANGAAMPAAAGALVAPAGVGPADAALQIGAQAQAAWADAARGLAWWYARPDEQAPRLWVSRGLPGAAAMAQLFGPAATI
jgi:type VI secretion system protein ImpM